MMVPDFAVVIPVYNENENLPELIGCIYHDVRCRPRFLLRKSAVQARLRQGKE